MSAFSMSRLDELQADDAIWGLDEDSQLELQRALRAANLEQDSSWERSAAVATLALQEDFSRTPSPWLLAALRTNAPAPQPTLIRRLSQPYWVSKSPVSKSRVLPYSVLAAALLMLAIVLVLDSRATNRQPSQAPSELRRELLQAADTAVWQWSGGTAMGDVVWHGNSQRGAMRFHDLAANDPTQRQYQLWIVDGKRNAAHPVDGGVFDVPAGQSDVVIPIDPKIVVHDAQVFVVTVEVPGGVVVSDREQIVVLAKPQ